jgi:hypothetical protein
MPKPDWIWLLVGIALGMIVIPKALATLNARKG